MNKIIIIIFIVMFGYGFYLYYSPPVNKDTETVDLSSGKEVTIEMKNFSFVPENIIISKGTKVIWINNDEAGHSIKSDPHPQHDLFPEMNSGNMNKGDIFSYVFENEDEYRYHCDPHTRGMIGKITVK